MVINMKKTTNFQQLVTSVNGKTTAGLVGHSIVIGDDDVQVVISGATPDQLRQFCAAYCIGDGGEFRIDFDKTRETVIFDRSACGGRATDVKPSQGGENKQLLAYAALMKVNERYGKMGSAPTEQACHCVGQFGPNPECGACGGDATVGIDPPFELITDYKQITEGRVNHVAWVDDKPMIITCAGCGHQRASHWAKCPRCEATKRNEAALPDVSSGSPMPDVKPPAPHKCPVCDTPHHGWLIECPTCEADE